MTNDCKLRRIKLSILGKIKIYKKTTVLEERRLKKLHKINPCFVYINPREEALCLKQMKGKRKKQYGNTASTQQESVLRASPFIPNPRLLENKPFTKHNSLMAMKQDAFFLKYNLDRDAIMKRCLFYKEDINHFIMVSQRYFDMKDREKIAEENRRYMERFKDVRLNQRVRILLTPLREVNKRTKEKAKELDNDHSDKLIDIRTIDEGSNRAKNCHYTDDGMTDADEMDVDKTLPEMPSRQNKKVHQIDVKELFISNGNEDEVYEKMTNSETGTNKLVDSCYTVSLAAQMQHQDKMKFKDILMDVATEFEKFSINKKSDTENAENTQRNSELVSNAGESNKEKDQNDIDMHEETSCIVDDPRQAFDDTVATSSAAINDKQNMIITEEMRRKEEDSSFVPGFGSDVLNIESNQNDCHAFKNAESLKQAAGGSVVSIALDGVNLKHSVSDRDNECEKDGELSNSDSECEKDELSNSSDNECEKDGELSNNSDFESEKDELSNNSDNEYEQDGELSKNNDNECEQDGELSNKSDFESEKHDDLPDKSDLDRESVIQQYTSDLRSTASDDDESVSGYSSGDKSKDKINQSDLESEEPVTGSKDEENTGMKHSEETFCGMDSNTISDSRPGVAVIADLSALVKLNEEKIEIPVRNGIAGAYEANTDCYDTEIPSVFAHFALMVTNQGSGEG